jgi:hypothetical protein
MLAVLSISQGDGYMDSLSMLCFGPFLSPTRWVGTSFVRVYCV